MTSQIAASNILSLRFHTEELDNNRKFQLNRERRLYLGFIVITTFEAERSVTLFCNGLTKTRLNLLEALRSGLLELTESVNGNIIMPPTAPSSPLGRRNIPPRPSPQHRQISIGVSADTTNAIWKRMLQPGQTYGLRLSKNNGKIVACYTDKFSDRPENAQKLRIGREGGTYYFTVHDDPAPPRLFARLSMPHQAHLTGPIPFIFTIEYTTDSPSPLVLDKSRSPLSVFSEDLKSLDSLIDCRDNSTGGKVTWSAAFGCWDSDPHPTFPDNDDFVEISVDKPWRFECTLENLENDYEYVRSMEGLEAEKTYTARIAGRALGPFSRWQYGLKGDLLEGTLEERIRRWELDTDKLGSLEVEMVGEDVEFVAVA
ncbi:hypothetical protein HBI56_150960 [Parastagonospora nodorum]|uniref:Uncharacterized protein n=2 Tax=Phaeosphaeria nodorum (strain SN15 / ATCC MYA-4574 / FGSC 10173) TaxID=321614 RepID=A0A7U2I705_PHANO|nr:hypothetical protein SNOG_12864 [Parastagonospora nodorum SN15]KAH3907971.1 hypothetical protein HBH56_183560 [Parastagonospora nodorum]EAT79664.1 hypothetical protein SNOG_12864 [Parastagonospora nodorum SN15]KAH3926147.1 hypothetical protein HBH54_172710 [Parastagonospora nodorum]KAH4017349.1 hypothetical protein HBI09_196140 [Parastagonospora nodorum]KAH4047061.1 hypothetical protein HBH49_176970 [Parastagonospora nodorum]